MKIIKDYNHKLSQRLVRKALKNDEHLNLWYRTEVEKSRKELSAMAFEKEWK